MSMISFKKKHNKKLTTHRSEGLLELFDVGGFDDVVVGQGRQRLVVVVGLVVRLAVGPVVASVPAQAQTQVHMHTHTQATSQVHAHT